LLKKGLGLDKRETELGVLKQQLDEVKRKKENWFTQMKGTVENKIAELKKELGKLPWTRYGNLEPIKHEILTKI
jgi:Txe/YoeB family toxin of Txe-Axe toxin-antitoxin module